MQIKPKPQWDITSCQVKWLSSENQQTVNVGEGMGRREPSGTVCGNANWYSQYENSMEVPLKTKNKATMWPCNPAPRYISWEKHKSIHASQRSL